jgi:superfamily I DNA/RNA helicase
VPAARDDLKGRRKDTDKTWSYLINHHGVAFDDDEKMRGCIKYARAALDVSVEVKDVIDFEDQLYLPLIYDIPFRNTYDFVFVDEAQDISSVQRRLIAKIMKPGGRAVFVGDPAQAIYGFRGADAKSIQRISEEFECKQLPLSISYRCPKSVVRLAQTLVPHIEAAPDAQDGRVRKRGGLFSTKSYQPGDLVLCRNNSPLVSMASWMRENNIPFRLLEGSKTGATIIGLLNAARTQSVADALAHIKKWRDTEVTRLKAQKKNDRLDYIYDLYDMVKRMAKKSKARNVAALCIYIDWVFGKKAEEDSKRPCVTLSTVHRAKGMEAERVFILDHDLMPSKHAEKGWEKKQERNIQYVAYTRAKSELIFVYSTKEKMGFAESKRIAEGGRKKQTSNLDGLDNEEPLTTKAKTTAVMFT